MSLESDKIEIARFILETEDADIIKRVKDIVEEPDNDWYNSLPDKVRESFDRGLEDIRKGNVIPHEEAMEQIRQWRNK